MVLSASQFLGEHIAFLGNQPSGVAGIPSGCYANDAQPGLVSSGDSVLTQVTFNVPAGGVKAEFLGDITYIPNNDLVANNIHMIFRDATIPDISFVMPQDPVQTTLFASDTGTVNLVTSGFHTFQLVYRVQSTGLGQDHILQARLEVCTTPL